MSLFSLLKLYVISPLPIRNAKQMQATLGLQQCTAPCCPLCGPEQLPLASLAYQAARFALGLLVASLYFMKIAPFSDQLHNPTIVSMTAEWKLGERSLEKEFLTLLYYFDTLLTVHLSITLVNDQLEAQFFYFIIRLL